jgi:hypothetical protein
MGAFTHQALHLLTVARRSGFDFTARGVRTSPWYCENDRLDQYGCDERCVAEANDDALLLSAGKLAGFVRAPLRQAHELQSGKHLAPTPMTAGI